jgi:hypothetical protein
MAYYKMLDRFGNEETVPTGGGGETIDPPVALPDSQTNWDASKVGTLVQVTAAEFNAAMAAMGTTQYGYPDSNMANTATSKSIGTMANALGIISGTYPLAVPITTTGVPANNYIVGVKLRVNTAAVRTASTGFMSLITADDTTAFPLGSKKMYADLGHNITIPIGSSNNVQYQYFLIKGPSLTTTRVGCYFWSHVDWPMGISSGGSTALRQFSPASAINDTGSGGSMLMMQMWATPTKSW